MRVLLIEPDSVRAGQVGRKLVAERFQVEFTDLGDEGVDLAKHYDFEAIILNMDPAGMTGLDVIRQIRASKIATPILAVSREVAVERMIQALNAGADEYLISPAHLDEMVARLRCIIRRTHGHAHHEVTAGPIKVNLSTRAVSVDGEAIYLTGREYRLLEYLALRKGKATSRDALMAYIYNGRDEPGEKIIDVFACKLRKKLAAYGASDHIETVHGLGLKLTEAPTKSYPRREVAPEAPRIWERVLDVLLKGDQPFRSVCAELEDIRPTTLRATLSVLGQNGDVVNLDKGHKSAVYRITETGRARRQHRLAA